MTRYDYDPRFTLDKGRAQGRTERLIEAVLRQVQEPNQYVNVVYHGAYPLTIWRALLAVAQEFQPDGSEITCANGSVIRFVGLNSTMKNEVEVHFE